MSVKVHRDRLGRPFSFIQYEEISCAQEAQTQLQNAPLYGRNIRIEQARVNRTLFLKFVKPITSDELFSIVQEYGAIEEHHLDFVKKEAGNSSKTRAGKGPAEAKEDNLKQELISSATIKFNYRQNAVQAYWGLRDAKFDVEW
jgi:RNA recognition motif-containing protein